jgi:nitrogen fixation NifU-like protein
VSDAHRILDAFRRMMGLETDGEAAEVNLGDLEALQGVVKFPVRIKCATLAWTTLSQAMENAEA